MALFGGEDKLELQVERLKLANENLRERLEEKDALIDKLLAQVSNLQDALMSREAPAAYAQIQRDRADSNRTEADIEAEKKAMQDREITDEYFKVMEKDRIFENPDDLNALLLPVLMEDTEPESLHNNGES